MTNEITLYLRYKPSSKLMKFSVQVEEDRLTCEELAWILSEKMADEYAGYLGGLKDKKTRQDLRRYKLGQYKFINNYLESIV